MTPLCSECAQRPVNAKGLCNPCYKRLVWRPRGGESVSRDRATSRKWKAENPDLHAAYHAAWREAQKIPCPACGEPMVPDATTCIDCIARQAEERRDRIVQMYEAGLLLREIAEALGFPGQNYIAKDMDLLRKQGRVGYRYQVKDVTKRVEQAVAPTLTRTEGVVNPPVRLSAEPSKPCPRCDRGTVKDANGSYWRCAYCKGTGQVKA